MSFKIILFGRPLCDGCQLMKPRLSNIANEMGVGFTYADLSTAEGEDIEANYPDLPLSLPVVLFISTASGEILDTLDDEDSTTSSAVWDWSESVLKEYIEYNVLTLTDGTYGGGTLPTAVVTPARENKSSIVKIMILGFIGKMALNRFS